MNAITVYSTPWCPFCVRAKRLLTTKGLAFNDIDVSRQPNLRQEMVQLSGQTSVPQIWLGKQHIGGCDELFALERANKIESMLAS